MINLTIFLLAKKVVNFGSTKSFTVPFLPTKTQRCVYSVYL